MTVVIDATVGGETSNSYLDLANAEAIAAMIPGGDAWVAATEEEKNMSLVEATRWLETLDYVGRRCTSVQRLKWPRQDAECDGVPASCTDIPYKIREAEVLLAIKYVASPSSFPGAGGGSNAPSGTFTKRQKLGDLEIEYAQFNSNVGSSCDDCDQSPILQSFPWLEAVLGCWIFNISSGAGYVMTRQCNENTVSLTPRTPVRFNLMDTPPY